MEGTPEKSKANSSLTRSSPPLGATGALLGSDCGLSPEFWFLTAEFAEKGRRGRRAEHKLLYPTVVGQRRLAQTRSAVKN